MAIFTTNQRPLRVQKRLLQFNNIPFAFGEVLNPSYTVAFKGETQAYTNATHGGYYPSLGEYGKLQTSQFDAELNFNFKGVECDDKVRYARYIRREFAKSGKLFATQSGNEIVWTNARVITINEIMDTPTESDMLRLNVSFELIDGYWRLASRTRAFLCHYCPNNFYEFDPSYCFDASDYLGQCDPRGTSRCIPCEIKMVQPVVESCDWKPLCNFPAKDLADMFGRNCSNRWFIDYSCEREKNYFCFDAPWGKKYNLDSRSSQNRTEIDYCSKTDLPTTFVRIRLAGVFGNPAIQVNDDILAWDPKTDGVGTSKQFPGILTVGFGPEVKLGFDTRDPDKNTIDVTRNFTRTNTPVFQIRPGYNKIIVTGNTRRESSQLYVEEIPLTF